MEEYIWLETPIHKNNFSKNLFEENPSLEETLKLSFDGSIVAVKAGFLEEPFESQQVALMRLGYKAWPKKQKVDSSESFYKYLALWAEL
tara:strand:+ start:18513 stop:18779 length:267 start_codon:yes stop_codon:yes gene_type:complete